MNFIKALPSGKHEKSLAPAKATLLGIVIGLTAAIAVAFLLPHDFSYSFLLVMLLSLVLFCGVYGYMLYLACDPARADRLVRIWRFIALFTIIGLLAAFPEFWRTGWSTSPFLVMMLLVFAYLMALFAAGAGLGIAHLVGHVVASFRQSAKLGMESPTDGVWDRDLDQGG